jgi:hypothetical protein
MLSPFLSEYWLEPPLSFGTASSTAIHPAEHLCGMLPPLCKSTLERDGRLAAAPAMTSGAAITTDVKVCRRGDCRCLLCTFLCNYWREHEASFATASALSAPSSASASTSATTARTAVHNAELQGLFGMLLGLLLGYLSSLGPLIDRHHIKSPLPAGPASTLSSATTATRTDVLHAGGFRGLLG